MVSAEPNSSPNSIDKREQIDDLRRIMSRSRESGNFYDKSYFFTRQLTVVATVPPLVAGCSAYIFLLP